MNSIAGRSFEMSYLHQELINDRIHTLHREAEEYRLASRVLRLERARRDVQKATDRLRRALLAQA
ncbi:hypothetical protein [Nonomuraea sp. NPDC046570]|uniref:hypothetical protein n=1 Tax=Nonomuraea sp. NPDC046570 TaxID=3155255 RepID=UPI0033FF03AC